MKKDVFNKMVKSGEFSKSDAIDVLEHLVNILIYNLYEPVKYKASAFIPDEAKLMEYGIENKFINWRDLKCESVKEVGRDYEITISKTSNRELCIYIQDFLRNWGWSVIVNCTA